MVFASIGAACRQASSDAANSGGTIAVTTVQARLTTMKDSLSVNGTVTPLPSADFVVSSPEPGQIVELPKNEGDKVTAGDLLVRLEIPSIAQEVATRQLEFADAVSKAEKAKAEAERLNGLYTQGLAARVLWENARSAQMAADSNLSQVKTKLDAAKALEGNTVVRARFSGVVAKRWHNVGDLLPGGEADPIIRVVDPGRLQVTAQVAATEAGRIVVGQVATVQAVTGPEPAVVSLKVTPSTPGVTMLDVRVNFMGPTLLPIDSLVQVDIAVDERRDVLSVPADAIQRNEGLAYVWVATENNVATRREVRTGLIVGNVAQIVSGLTAGENVITTAISELTEGTPITIGKS